MANNKLDFTRAGLKVIFPIFLVITFSSCASTGTSTSDTALSYAKPLIKADTCGNGKGIYNKVKNSHGSKNIIVTIETDMSPDPNNWYPSQRDFNLKPGQLRILGCSIVDEGAGKPDSRVSHTIINARFQ